MKTEINDRYLNLVEKCLDNGCIDDDDIRWILTSSEVSLLSLLQAAYMVRYTYFKNNVRIHILNNVQSGGCTEDCKYCAQSSESENKTDIYPMQSDSEILTAAAKAYEEGAYRHCMVFSGRHLGKNRIEKICSVVRQIKKQYPMEICVSAGFLTEDDGVKLADAGVNRYNHNLNTSSSFYQQICTTHEYSKRVATINTAKNNGLDICSGIIIGLGEKTEDILRMTSELQKVNAASIPVNFFIPVDGHRLVQPQKLTPHYCLKVLSVFRFTNPRAEIRAAAGREYHLRSLQGLSLYPANSIFAKGYLTTSGDDIASVRQMINDFGFVVES